MKRYIYFIFISVLFLLAACDSNDDYQTLPLSPVNFKINTRYLDNELLTVPTAKAYTTPRQDDEQIGYGGLLVVSSIYSSNNLILLAYDLACPYDRNPNTHIAPANDALTAKCPSCNSVFDLHRDGLAIEGKALQGKNNLTLYRVMPTNAQGEYRVINW